ncbi:MAG TPA: hypothetical protein VFH68_22105 [Polyangia bacterium]|nr:hypothetical protein [Polyangia bacterium]
MTWGAVCGRGMLYAATAPVGVVAPAGSRLAGELKRELAAANLASVSMVASDRDWPAEMTDLVALPYLQGVVVGSDDGRMIVFSRAAVSGRVEVRFELHFDPNDRPARRRACLAVVESLRVLGEAAPAPHDAPAISVTGGPPVAVPAASPTPVVAASPAGAVNPVVPPARTPEVSTFAPASLTAPAPPREPWVLGVATMLDVDRTLGAPMGHLQFMWFIPVSGQFAFRAQTMWPLMGTSLRAGANDVRVWTFGAAVGGQYAFASAQERWRPYAGVAAGSQLLLTDTASAAAEKPRALFVPSVNARLQAGVRVVLASRLHLLTELEATRDWLLQSSHRADYRDSAANTLTLHALLGVLFEY